MELRMLTAALLLALICSSAIADEQITIRPGFRDRWIIEDATGNDLGTIRPLNDGTLVIEDPNGRDIGTIRDDDAIGTLHDCGDDRASLSCLLEQDD